MAKRLKDLRIKSISLVSDKAKPVNQEARIAFIKSNEINKEDTIVDKEEMNLFEKFKSLFVEKATEKAPEKVETEPIVIDAVTKGEMDAFKVEIANEFKTLKAEIVECVQNIAKAVKDTNEAMKNEMQAEIMKAKRAVSPVTEQPSLDELLKASLNPDNMFNTNRGDMMNKLIEKGVKDNTLVYNNKQTATDSYSQAFNMLMGL